MISETKWLSLMEPLSDALMEVGACVLKCRAEGDVGGAWEGTQFKAEADLRADACMRKALARAASLPYLSEEDVAGHAQERPSCYWLVDPIDGTASFAEGYDGFVCQAALIEGSAPVLGGVYAPALDRMYLACCGHGATLDGRTISVCRGRSDAPVIVDNYPQPKGIAARLHSSLRCSGYVESGSIGLKLCLVAEGRADVFAKDVVVRDWDLAPGHLILEEAGGALVDLRGDAIGYDGPLERTGGFIAAASGDLARKAIASLETGGAP